MRCRANGAKWDFQQYHYKIYNINDDDRLVEFGKIDSLIKDDNY